MATDEQGYRSIKAHGYRGTRLGTLRLLLRYKAIGTLRQMTTEVQCYRNIKAHGYRGTRL